MKNSRGILRQVPKGGKGTETGGACTVSMGIDHFRILGIGLELAMEAYAGEYH